MTQRRKQTVREKILSFDDGDSALPKMGMYSTLSKKPADLKTTDVELTAIRVFLSDGSHRTISSTPETTCGDILDSLLRKLGLLDQKEEYGLQIKYTYSDSRIADNDEKVSEINPHVWDSIDRIFLSKKSGCHKKRKRVATFSGVPKEELCSIYDNVAVTCKLTDAAEEVGGSATQPTLLNEALAGGFAKAWSVGLELHEAGKEGGQKPLEISNAFEPIYANVEQRSERASYSSYTLDRRSRIKKSPHPHSPSLPRRVQLNSKPKEAIDVGARVARKEECDHFLIQTGSGKSLSPSGDNRRSTTPIPCVTQSQLANRRNLPLSVGRTVGKLLSGPRRRSQSVDCLVTSMESERGRDSGFSELGSQSSLNDSTLGKRFNIKSPFNVKRKKKSLSAECIPKVSLQQPWQVSTNTQSLASSTSSLALSTVKAKSKAVHDQSRAPSLSKLNSAHSVERLTVGHKGSTKGSLQLPIPPAHSPTPPPVPKRFSSNLENCTISDSYLVSQGKRLTQILQITPKKERSTFKSLQAAFSRVGTLMKRSRSTSLDSANLDISTGITSRRTLGFPSMQLRRADTLTPSSKSAGSIAEVPEDYSYIPVSSVTSIPKPKLKAVHERTRPGPQADYLTLIPTVLTGSESEKQLTENEDAEVKYRSRTTVDVSGAYQSPPTRSLGQERSGSRDRDMYENQHVQTGPKNTITLDGSPLHSYVVPSNFPPGKMPQDALYTNSEIHPVKGSGIGIGGDELHVYHVPSPQAYLPIPPPPPLPPKPGETDKESSTSCNKGTLLHSFPVPTTSTVSASASYSQIPPATGKKVPLLPHKPLGHNSEREPTPTSPRPSSTPAFSHFSAAPSLGPRSQSQLLPELSRVVPSRADLKTKSTFPPLPPKPSTHSPEISAAKSLNESSLSCSFEVPGYSKLSFDNKAAPVIHFSKPPPPPGPPPPKVPPLSATPVPGKVPERDPVQKKGVEVSIRDQPLPELPLEASRESGAYEEIISPPFPFSRRDAEESSDNEYMAMSPSGVPQTMTNKSKGAMGANNPIISGPGDSAKSFSQQLSDAFELSSKCQRVVPPSTLPRTSTPILPPPPPPLPSKPNVTITEPVPAPGGLNYRSWSTPAEDPQQELNKKLRKQLDTLQAKATHEASTLSNQTKLEVPSPPEEPKKVSFLLPCTLQNFQNFRSNEAVPEHVATSTKCARKPWQPAPVQQRPTPPTSQSKGKLPLTPPVKPKNGAPSPPPPPPPPPPSTAATPSQDTPPTQQHPTLVTSQSKGKLPLTPPVKPKHGTPPPNPPPPPPPPPPLNAATVQKRTTPARSNTHSTKALQTSSSPSELFAQELSKKLSSLSHLHRT